MKEDTEFIQSILPKHYTCEPRDGGVFCYSEKGIDESDKEHWKYIMLAVKQRFGKRFKEVYHHTSTNHVEFTVYIKSDSPQ